MELNGLNIADVLYGFSIMLKATFAKFYDGFIEDETTKRLDDRMLFCLMYWFVFFVFFVIKIRHYDKNKGDAKHNHLTDTHFFILLIFLFALFITQKEPSVTANETMLCSFKSPYILFTYNPSAISLLL